MSDTIRISKGLYHALLSVAHAGRDAVSEGARTIELGGTRYVLESGAHVPEGEFMELADAINDLDELEDLEKRGEERAEQRMRVAR